ncbi:MAG: aminotransferase class I/II-fold pyridoxal phosphate-dependent enzyme [Sedimenticolaceae bacterium]
MSIFDKFQDVAAGIEQLKELGVMPFGAEIEHITSATDGVVLGHPVILAGTNNYLGLTFDPGCISAAREALLEQGTGTTGSRLANGSYGGHLALEQELAAFFGTPSAIVFSTGFLATMGAVSTLAGPGDRILMDADCHASIYEGTRVTSAEVIRFRHNNPDDLEKRLRRLEGQEGNNLIVVEGIYSMLGDRAPLVEIAALAKQFEAYLMVDEAHSLGVLGTNGRGLAEEAGVEDAVDFVVGTFSKSLGSVGGFCTSRHPQLEYMRYNARPYIFTASPAPSVIASTRVALQILRDGQDLRERLWRNANRLYSALQDAGFRLGPEPSPVIAIQVESTEQALVWWNQLLEEGVYVNLVLPPATPTGGPLLRCSLSAAHTDAQIDRLQAALCGLRTAEACA